MISEGRTLRNPGTLSYRMAPAMCCVALLFAGSSYSQGDIDALIGYLASALAILYVRIRLRPAAWEEADAPASTVGGRS